MALDKLQIYEILAKHLSEESKWFLFTLAQEKGPMHKEKLRDMANEQFKKNNPNHSTSLIVSRHGLDIHTARLEGAGLVHVQEIGRIRMYSLTELGQELLTYLRKKQ